MALIKLQMTLKNSFQFIYFIYDVIDGQVVGGSKLVVQNEWLGKLKIEKPLCQLDLTRYNGAIKKKH